MPATRSWTLLAVAAMPVAAPIAIPNVASLVGTRLVLQGIAIDAAASGGLSLTNALELWLR